MKIYTTKQLTRKIKRKEKNKKIISLIFYLIIAIILTINIMIIMQKMKKSQNATNVMGIKAYSVSSGSMEPYLKIGDLIVTITPNKRNIKVGDIITFKEEGVIITHRVIDIVNENGKKIYKTKGDNNNVADDKMISQEDLEGIYMFKIPLIGKIVIKAQSPQGMIVIALSVYFSYQIVSIKEDRKRYRHEKRKRIERQHYII